MVSDLHVHSVPSGWCPVLSCGAGKSCAHFVRVPTTAVSTALPGSAACRAGIRTRSTSRSAAGEEPVSCSARARARGCGWGLLRRHRWVATGYRPRPGSRAQRRVRGLERSESSSRPGQAVLLLLERQILSPGRFAFATVGGLVLDGPAREAAGDARSVPFRQEAGEDGEARAGHQEQAECHLAPQLVSRYSGQRASTA
jgi:hypothetical protein